MDCCQDAVRLDGVHQELKAHLARQVLLVQQE
jgi:hypothetical protein